MNARSRKQNHVELAAGSDDFLDGFLNVDTVVAKAKLRQFWVDMILDPGSCLTQGGNEGMTGTMKTWIQYPDASQEPDARPRTAGNWLVERLRRAIIQGELPADSVIRQEEIAATYNVSRMPVRQALDILAAEGWIEQRPHRGAFVAALDADKALELFELREALEVLAIERSFPNLTDEQLLAIEGAWNALRRGEGDLFLLHQSLHLTLYAAAGPRILHLVMQQLDAVQRYLRFEKSALEVSDADTQEHADLVAAALARDVDRGIEILREHVAGGGRGIARSLREMGLCRSDKEKKQ